ncbi:MAG: hypothetical protein K6G15_03275 [Desulfovibrio sp.]|nr:hypothetical protein [Desulfovibrio sp.]
MKGYWQAITSLSRFLAGPLLACLLMLSLAATPAAKTQVSGKSGQQISGNPTARQLFLNAFAKAHAQAGKRDLAGALADYEAAANLGYAPAQYNLARMYLEGLGVPKNEEAAYLYFLSAAEKGLLLAQYNLGVLFEIGLGTKQDPERARYWYAKAAEQGDREAQYRLGRLYEAGDVGVPRDLTQAVIWYTRSAEQGFAPAQNNLATLYESGLGGVDKDLARAVYWYHKAALKGHAIAQYNLGQCYLKGLGVRQDLRKGQAWLARAEAHGFWLEESGPDLGPGREGRSAPARRASQVRERDLANDDGKRISVRIRDLDGGFTLETKEQALSRVRSQAQPKKESAKKPEPKPESEARLPAKGKVLLQAKKLYAQAMAYEKGTEQIEKNGERALQLYQEAAQLNYAPASYRLGRLYEADRSLDSDYRLTWKYYNLAAQGGHAKAQYRLGRLYEQGLGTPKNIALALYWYGQAKAQGDARAKQAFAQLSAD